MSVKCRYYLADAESRILIGCPQAAKDRANSSARDCPAFLLQEKLFSW